MTELVRTAIERLARLADAEQDRIATIILEELEKRSKQHPENRVEAAFAEGLDDFERARFHGPFARMEEFEPYVEQRRK